MSTKQANAPVVFIVGGQGYTTGNHQVEIIDLDVLEIGSCPLCGTETEGVRENNVCPHCGIDWNESFDELENKIVARQRPGGGQGGQAAHRTVE